jgi:hypothetical protein
MKTNSTVPSSLQTLAACLISLLFAGCATTDQAPSTSSSAPASAGPVGHFSSKYQATDGRTVSIGKSTAASEGWSFKEPHMDKCWIADNFNFTGYDVLYIAPTRSTAKFHDDEARPHELAKEALPVELAQMLAAKGVFPKVVTSMSDAKPGARVLNLENTIIEYSKGGGAARMWVGIYGGGQPVLRIEGKMTDGDKTVFTFEARRSGVSANARMSGVLMKDEDIQIEDIRSMALDLADFMAAIAGKYQPKN